MVSLLVSPGFDGWTVAIIKFDVSFSLCRDAFSKKVVYCFRTWFLLLVKVL